MVIHKSEMKANQCNSKQVRKISSRGWGSHLGKPGALRGLAKLDLSSLHMGLESVGGFYAG